MPKGIKILKSVAIVVLAAALFWFMPGRAESSWIINPGDFHVSAHGQLSCVDCHADISVRDLHPDPANVNKKLTDFFNYEKCITCHDEVLEKLEQGYHGEEMDVALDDYKGCVYCHDPHTQEMLEDDSANGFTPDRPIMQQCAVCHTQRSSLPEPSPDDRECVNCHVFELRPDSTEVSEPVEQFCFACHGMESKESRNTAGKPFPIIAEEDYKSTPHADISCIICHPESDQYGHADQERGDCAQCHTLHDEKVTGDAHIIVDCRTCHLEGITPLIDSESKMISWEGSKSEGASSIHHMVITDDEASCRRCHFRGNEVGAASMILPPKSIICIPCHTGTFSIGDTTTIIFLLVFLAGMVMIFSYLVSGRVRRSETRGGNIISGLFSAMPRFMKILFSAKLLSFIKTMLLDVLLQRRLFRKSGARWFIHGLIFFPFMIRFLWGIATLLGSLFMPDVPLVWAMIDKNDPATAFLFDITGLILIIGIFSTLARGISCRHNQPSGLPEQDLVALFLIAAIVIVGFILEGMRIAMTGWPEGADYGIVGYALSLLFRGCSGLTELYGYAWYTHAVMAGIFIAYLPFGRLIHIIFAPVVLGINAVFEKN